MAGRNWDIDDIAFLPKPQEGRLTGLYKAINYMAGVHHDMYQQGTAASARDQHVMIVLSDGADNHSFFDNRTHQQGGDWNGTLYWTEFGSHPVTQAQLRSTLESSPVPNLRVHVVGFGQAVNEQELTSIATAGEGQYFYGEDATTLERLFTDVQREIATLQTIGVEADEADGEGAGVRGGDRAGTGLDPGGVDTVGDDPDPARRALPVPGANDGASGVAILLEMARLLAADPPPFPLLLAFWDGEDLGENCYGSRLYARQSQREEMPAWLPRRSILLDMVGKRELRCITDTASIAQAPALWDEVHEAARALGLERHFFGPAYRIGDDHIHLAGAGIESIVLIDFDYPEWHTTADTADRCSPESLAVIGEVLQRFIADTAAASTSP